MMHSAPNQISAISDSHIRGRSPLKVAEIRLRGNRPNESAIAAGDDQEYHRGAAGRLTWPSLNPTDAAAATPRSDRFEVRRIGNAEIRESLAQGWDDFLAKRGDLIFLGLIYPLIGFASAFLFTGGNLLHLFFPVAAGISLLGPVAAVGFYELARRREDGLEFGLVSLPRRAQATGVGFAHRRGRCCCS